MGDVIHRKIIKYRILIILAMTVMLGIVSCFSWKYEQMNIDERQIRVKVNQLVYALEQKNDLVMEKEFAFPYCVADLFGTVQVSTMKKFQAGQVIDVHTMGGVCRYVVPLYQKNKASAVLVVDCSKYQKKLARKNFIRDMTVPVSLWLLVLLFVYRICKIQKTDLWQPIKQLHHATKALMERKPEVKVQYDYDGEVGQLCHDFELMREEVLDSYEREKKLKEKEQVMYASISHDLKTPLATITGYIEGILYDVVQTPEEIKDSAERMLNKTIVLNKLIDDILEHSKSQLHELSIHKKEIYAKDYFLEMMKGYELDGRQRQYEFTYDLPENVLITIDPDRIGEVVQNLVDNAVKYGQKNLKIEVHFEMFVQTENMIVISVHDNGRGIDAVDLPFIFDMFYRGNKARTLDVPGSGLGLNISKYIIEQHGGQIECDSIVGVGTTMSFSIPYK